DLSSCGNGCRTCCPSAGTQCHTSLQRGFHDSVNRICDYRHLRTECLSKGAGAKPGERLDGPESDLSTRELDGGDAGLRTSEVRRGAPRRAGPEQEDDAAPTGHTAAGAAQSHAYQPTG